MFKSGGGQLLSTRLPIWLRPGYVATYRSSWHAKRTCSWGACLAPSIMVNYARKLVSVWVKEPEFEVEVVADDWSDEWGSYVALAAESENVETKPIQDMYCIWRLTSQNNHISPQEWLKYLFGLFNCWIMSRLVIMIMEWTPAKVTSCLYPASLRTCFEHLIWWRILQDIQWNATLHRYPTSNLSNLRTSVQVCDRRSSNGMQLCHRYFLERSGINIRVPTALMS